MSFLTSSAVKRDVKGSHSINSGGSSELLDRLAAVLPHGYKFGVYHLSTPPTKTDPLCSAPPGERPDKTYSESHFLAVSIDVQNQPPSQSKSKRSSPGADELKESGTKESVLVFAIEIFIFTTAYQTTFFVSKADSTGYLQSLNLPKGTPSPVREISSAFLTYLIEHRWRKTAQLVVNLFARAQAQYLFPGSVENMGKHVLDDWGLVRWWCRVLNPLLEGPGRERWGGAKGYLIVPGLEETEMRAFIPRTAAAAANWAIGHPMERISHYSAEFDWVPLRCLIPRYPDDPKSRFRDELDGESSKWKEDMGSWKSVKTLDQFWEMMAFRQECSSGRLTGFIWVVFDPKGSGGTAQDVPVSISASVSAPASQIVTPNSSFDTSTPSLPPSTPPRRRVDILARTPQSSPLKLGTSTPPKPNNPPERKRVKKVLSGRIIPRTPKVKTQQRSYLNNRPTTTAYYHWPVEGCGDKIVDESDFKRITELLLNLDFSTLDKATGATQRWISEASMGARWGYQVTGKRVLSQSLAGDRIANQVTNLTGLVRRKIGANNGALASATPLSARPINSGAVNVLGAGLVRKKKKEAVDQEPPPLSAT
ncbi:histone acetylation protein-domain-containing protein [Lasiosphaeria ovina]|uniref:histone acetyltransferase n=1 Tax=Lasiosphaeria ovina TaxID=92902 RepID=A0AAE0N895_9PEZI|nr:histone acetylation protein-domain-containing protein [Lasiosphaeria ovina]